MEAPVEAIVAAEQVLIAGTDQMAFFASYLRHLLMLLDIRAEVVASRRRRRRSAGSPGSTRARS